MSQAISSGTFESASEPTRFEGANEFDYKPVTPLAPISLFLGLCSFIGLIGVYALSVAATGSLVGLAALWTIRRSEGTVGGKVLALLGTMFSVGFLIAGSGYHSYIYAMECPEGYERVSFNWLSKQAPSVENGVFKFAPEVTALDGKPIFIKGYMLTTRQTTDLSTFVLVKDRGECCFGGQPKPTDMIVVNFKDGMTVNHREQQLVGVAGIFRAKQEMQAGQLVSIYTLEGTHFR